MARQTTDSFPEEREDIILDVLKRQGKVRVTEVCDILSIAPSTARLLLQSMQDKGLLQRTHGGAIPIDKPEQTKPTRDFSEIENYEAKLKVAKLAASTIKDEDYIINVNVGTSSIDFDPRTEICVSKCGIERYVLVDSSKFNVRPFIDKVMKIDEIHHVITNDDVSQENIDALKASGVDVLLA